MARANRYRQVLATYPRRPGIAWLGVAAVVWLLPAVIEHYSWRLNLHTSLWGFALETGYYLVPMFSLIALVTMIVTQMKEQAAFWRVSLIDTWRRPHLVVAAAALLVTALVGGTWLYWMSVNPWQPASLVGCLGIAVPMAALAGWLAMSGSHWLPFVLVPLWIIATATQHMQRAVWRLIWDYPPPRVWLVWSDSPSFWPVWRAVLLAIGLIALLALVWWPPKAAEERDESARPSQTGGFASGSHQPLQGLFARALHRRVFPMGPGAPWVLGAVLGLALCLAPLWKNWLYSGPANLMQSLVLLTLIPGVAVALSWRERWPILGYEALYPARRDQFAGELLIAMAIDVAEFWIPMCLAVMVSAAVWDRPSLVTPKFGLTLAASALMQGLLLGGTFLATRPRALMPYLVALAALVTCVAAPVAVTWSRQSPLSPHGLLHIALAELIVGAGLAAIGHVAWTRGELA